MALGHPLRPPDDADPLSVGRDEPRVGRVEAELARLTGYRFREARLLEEALTHRSTTGQGGARPAKGSRRRVAAGGGPAGIAVSNERLEFLGDRVLGLIVAGMLLEHYPDAAEGALTKRQQVLVSRDTLAEVGEELGLDRWLKVDRGSVGGAARITPNMRADACEALIGALYLDGGLEAARALVEPCWRARVAAMAEPPKDPKMALQEWTLTRGLPLPSYTVLETSGPAHALRFRVRVEVEGRTPTTAEAGSKRVAEQAAARLMLEAIAAGDHERH